MFDFENWIRIAVLILESQGIIDSLSIDSEIVFTSSPNSNYLNGVYTHRVAGRGQL